MLGASWKVKLFALGILALGFAGHPLNHYLPILGLNWATFCTAAQGILTGGAFLYTKQVDVHGGTKDTGTRPAPVNITVAAPKPNSFPPPPISRTVARTQNAKREDLP